MTQPELFYAVKAHMGWDDDKTRVWFDTENPHLCYVTPAEFYYFRPEKCERFIINLIKENRIK